MTIHPFIGIYREKKSGDFLLESYVESLDIRGTYVVWGNRVRLSPEEMRQQGLQRVLRDLDDFKTRIAGPGFVPLCVPPAEQRSFVKAHDRVTVALDDGVLEIDPQERGTRGGYIGSPPEERRRLRLPITDEQFFAELLAMF